MCHLRNNYCLNNDCFFGKIFNMSIIGYLFYHFFQNLNYLKYLNLFFELIFISVVNCIKYRNFHGYHAQ